jgi:hypothetical protein
LMCNLVKGVIFLGITFYSNYKYHVCTWILDIKKADSKHIKPNLNLQGLHS